MEALNDHIILPRTCTSNLGGCQVHDKTFVWKTVGHKCPLEGVRQIQVVREGTLLIDHTHKVIFNNTGVVPSPAGCPTTNLIKTEYPDLFLSTVPTFPVTTDNLEIDKYINNRDNYLAYRSEQLTGNTKNVINVRVCKQEYNEQGIIKIDDHHYAQVKGDIVYVFDCVEKISKIVTMENCYDAIPIEQNWFVDTRTRVATKNAAKIECNKFFPNTILTMEGWVTINPHIKPSASPRNISLIGVNINHESLAHGGIYTEQELAAWEAQIQFQTFHETILRT